MSGKAEIRNLEKRNAQRMSLFIVGFRSGLEQEILRLDVTMNEITLAKKLECPS